MSERISQVQEEKAKLEEKIDMLEKKGVDSAKVEEGTEGGLNVSEIACRVCSVSGQKY